MLSAILQELAELQPGVAGDARIGRPPGGVFGHEVCDNPAEFLLEIQDIEGDIQPLGDAAGILGVGRATAALRAARGPGAPPCGPCRMNSPTTSWPARRNSQAATLLSTPPDIARTTRDMIFAIIKPPGGQVKQPRGLSPIPFRPI